MKEIARITITVEKLQEDGYLAKVEKFNPDGHTTQKGDEIYGNTLIQIRQRIGKRLEKLIVEEES